MSFLNREREIEKWKEAVQEDREIRVENERKQLWGEGVACIGVL